MSLMIGTGPFGEQSQGRFNFDTGILQPHTLYMEPSPKHIRVVFEGETVADSRNVKLLHETERLPAYYFPQVDTRSDVLSPTDHSTHCPFKGDASYQSVCVGDRTAENAVWSYPKPNAESPIPADHLAFDWGAMDAWYEEDEEVFVHPRDPYHRIDVLPSSRHVQIIVQEQLIAETRRPRLLLETGLPTRYYIPREDIIRGARLPDSGTTTMCPYKGEAHYHSVEANGEIEKDVAWFYPDPLHDAAGLADCVCFFNERVDIVVDGEKEGRPRTRWS